MNYWQVAAGEGTRDFSDVFLKYGVILMGSGHPGSFLEHPDRYKGHKGWRRKIVTLAEKLKRGDAVILKRGHGTNGRILAVGRVASDYEWLEPFEDVDGWDLRHGRRVEWFKPNSPISVEGLARGTVKRSFKGKPRNVADTLLLPGGKKGESFETPQQAKAISDEELVRNLIENGLRPADAEAVIRAIWHLRRLAGWYVPQMDEVSEDDVRTFLIVPLLEALGWTPKQIKLERTIGGKRADVSLFREEFRKDAKASVILEAKRMGMGLDRAERQIRKYADECNMVVTSTGDRYWLYVKKKCEKWDASAMKETHLLAYMNLFLLKDRHPYLENVGGAPDLLKSLMPG